jgi:hypothetical protein
MGTIGQWAAKNRNMLFLLGCVVLGQVVLYFTTTANAKREVERYKALQLAGRVTKMLSYSHGLQKVQMATGETQSLMVPTAEHQYMQAGDSVVKAAGSEQISIYRQFADHTEVMVFGPDATGHRNLIKRVD